MAAHIYEIISRQKDIKALDLLQIWQASENGPTENCAPLPPSGHRAENEKPIRIDSLTKLDLADVPCMEYMSAGDSGTYLPPIDSLLPFGSGLALQSQDWKLKGKGRPLKSSYFSISCRPWGGHVINNMFHKDLAMSVMWRLDCARHDHVSVAIVAALILN